MAPVTRRRVIIIAALLLGVPLAVVLASVAYLTSVDLGRHRALIELRLSRALGYRLTFEELHIDLALRGESMLEARGLSLTNPSAEADSTLLEIDHVTLRADPWALLGGVVHVRDLELSGVRAVATRLPSGASNWRRRRTPAKPAVPWRQRRMPTVLIDRAVGHSLSMVFGSPTLPHPVEIRATGLEVTADASGTLFVHLTGDLGDRPLTIDGTVAAVTQLLVASSVRADLAVALAGAHGTVRGAVVDLATLDGLELVVNAEGPSSDQVTALLGLPSLGAGGFRLAARLAPAAGGNRIALEAVLGELEVTVDGELDALRHPGRIDAAVHASGPSLAAAGAFGGFGPLPDQPFEIAGRVVWAGFPVTLDGIAVRVGKNHLGIDGVVGCPPRLQGTDLRFEGSGPDAATIASLFGVRLPSSPYRFSGRLSRHETGAEADRVHVEIGPVRIEAHGRLGEPPEFEGTEITLEASGPSLAPFRALVGAELPNEEFHLAAKLRPARGAFEIERAELRLGSESARVDGRLVTRARLAGSTLHVRARGDDLSHLAWAVPGVELPASAFSLSSDVTIEPGALGVSGLTASLAGIRATADGRVGLGRMGGGTDITVDVVGPDVSVPLALAGVTRAPALPYSVSSRVRVAAQRVDLDHVAARVGDLELEGSGSAPVAGGLDGASADLSGRGPRLSDLAAFGAPAALPGAPFTLSGGLRVEGNGVRCSHTTVTLGEGHRIALEGTVVPSAGLAGSDVTLTVAGPELQDLGLLVAGMAKLPKLPAEPYALTAELAVDSTGYDIRALRATLGPAVASASGRLGRWPRLEGTDLTLDLNGPNAALLTALAGITVPVAPFELSGRVVRGTGGFAFHGVAVRLGEYRAWLDGRLGEPPNLVGSELGFRAEGPDLELFRQLVGGEPLPVHPFRVAGRASGSPLRFRIDDLDLRFGSTDIRGFARLGFEDRPQLKVRLESDRLNLGQLTLPSSEPAEPAPQPKPSGKRKDPSTRVFSDEPLDLAVLDRFDADATWQIGTLQLVTTRFDQLSVTAKLDHGTLEIGPVDVSGEHGGRLEGRVLVEPRPAGHSLEAHLSLTEARANLVRDPAQAGDEPTMIDTRIDLHAVGASPHELAAGANGRLILSLKGGKVDSSIGDLLGADLILTVLKALNPFRGESSPTVALECAVILGDMTDGVLVLEPMAIKNENLTIFGDGRVDFGSEKLDFEWVTKPRKGFGLSATVLTNRSVKLGGTLARPAVKVDAVEALASTGAAVATAGLSLVGRALYDRVTSGKKICKKALEEADRRLAGEGPHHHSRSFR